MVDFFLYKQANVSQNIKECSGVLGVCDNEFKIPNLSDPSGNL